ncbi:MAG: tetratricopeptide (TPR) repeat protein [Chlamydiales bacterium]|jgi:tetratricopeptide (TPR) repeat protein
MKNVSKVWLPLLLASPLAAPRPIGESEWTGRLFYPLLEAPRIGFYVGLDDLCGVTFDEPGERVEKLRKQVDHDDDALENQLRLVRALLGDEEPDEAQELLESLARELVATLKENPEDWETVAKLGEVSRVIGIRFQDRNALRTALSLLDAARTNDDALWRVRVSLAQLFIWESSRMRSAGEAAEADEALKHARELAREAIDIDDDEFLPHAILFLAELTEASFEYQDDAIGGLARMVQIADHLENAAYTSEDPEVAVAISNTYVLLYMLHGCQDQWDTVEAFEELAAGDGEGSARARAADEIVESMAALDPHHRLWSSASLLRWWLARHAQLDEAEEIFDEALEAARDPALVLESAIGLETRNGAWDAAEVFAEQLLEEVEDERSLYLNARLAGMRGDLELSIEGFEEALELEPDMPEASIGLAISLLKQGDDLERAIELLEAVLDEDDELFTAHFALASALLLDDESDAAREHLETALELAEDERIVDFEEAAEAALEELDDE